MPALKFDPQPQPKAFDLRDIREVYRLLSECRGYLHTCHRQHGTDWQGRQYAMDALDQLQAMDFKLVPDPAQS